MKAADFNLRDEVAFSPETGIVRFSNTRLLLFDADALGLLREEMRALVGVEQARKLFLRFGYQHGYADCQQLKTIYNFDNEIELLASGPVIHSWQGLVNASPMEIRFSRETGDFFFTGLWTNSFEAEQHLCYHSPDPDPVCWSLMGYASGYCTAFFGSQLLAIEPVCKGKGDDRCEWKIQPPSVWGDEAAPYLSALSDLLEKG